MERILFALMSLTLGCVSADFSSAAEKDPSPNQGQARDRGQRQSASESEPLPTHALARLGSSRWRHGAGIIRSALSADGKRLATVSDTSVVVWDMRTGNVLFRFSRVQDPATASSHYVGPRILAFSPDGKKLGIAFNDDFTGVWDLENGGRFRRFTGADIGDSHGHCQFTPDGKRFILLYDDCIRFWDPRTGNLHGKVPASFAVSDISPDARMYVQVDHDRNVAFNLRDFKTGAVLKRFDVRAGEGDVVFAPDGKTLVVIDEFKKEIQVWDAPPTEARWTVRLPKFAGMTQEGWIYPYCVCFTADSRVLMFGNGRGQIHRWDLAAKKELPVLSSYPGEIVGVHELPNKRTLVAARADGLIHQFDATTNAETSEVGKYEGSSAVVVSPDGHLAAVGDSRGRLDVWELRPLKLRHALCRNGPPVSSLAFTADGKTLAVGLNSETVCFYDIVSGQGTRRISLKETAPNDSPTVALSILLLSPDGRFLYASSRANELVMWDLANGKAQWRRNGAFDWGEGATALSPDGKTLAFVPEGSEVFLLDALSGKQRHAVKLGVTKRVGIEERVHSLAFSPDGHKLAAALEDGTIALLDPTTLKEGKRLVTKAFFSGNLAFSPDGRRIGAGVVESVRVWDTTTGEEVSRLDGHTDWVDSVSFGRDGRTLLSSGRDSQVFIWSLDARRHQDK